MGFVRVQGAENSSCSAGAGLAEQRLEALEYWDHALHDSLDLGDGGQLGLWTTCYGIEGQVAALAECCSTQLCVSVLPW